MEANPICNMDNQTTVNDFTQVIFHLNSLTLHSDEGIFSPAP